MFPSFPLVKLIVWRHNLSRPSSSVHLHLRLPYSDGVWSTMSLVWQDPITLPCIFSRKQQPEHTYAFGTVVAQLTPRMWGQAPTHLHEGVSTQRTAYGAYHHGWPCSPFLRAPPGNLNLLPLCDPSAIHRCDVDYSAITRHQPRRNVLLFFLSSIGIRHSPLKGFPRSVRPSMTVNDSSRLGVVQCRPRSRTILRIQLQ